MNNCARPDPLQSGALRLEETVAFYSGPDWQPVVECAETYAVALGGTREAGRDVARKWLEARGFYTTTASLSDLGGALRAAFKRPEPEPRGGYFWLGADAELAA